MQKRRKLVDDNDSCDSDDYQLSSSPFEIKAVSDQHITSNANFRGNHIQGLQRTVHSPFNQLVPIKYVVYLSKP